MAKATKAAPEENLPAVQSEGFELTEKDQASKLPLVTYDALKNYAFMNKELMEILEENLAGQTFSPSDFERIKFPSSGTLFWQVPDLSGDMTPVKELVGMVIMQKYGRVYWQNEFKAGENVPPDCSSTDNIQGIGNPGGLCATCPYAQWGSKTGSNAQACKQVGILFLVRSAQGMPILVPVPPTSLKPVKQFMLKMTSEGVKVSHAIVGLGLELATSKGGKEYSVIKPKVLSILPEAAEPLVDDYIAKFRRSFDSAVSTLNQGDIS